MIFKLKPALVDYLWGGDKLKTKWGKEGASSSCGEAWELSFHKDGASIINSGEQIGKKITEVVTKEQFGTNCQDMDFFPILVKIIDANDFLSIQVHPNDEYALKNEGQLGKTEMWYIVGAEKNAGIYFGFKEEISKETYKNSIKSGEITNLLNFIEVSLGDCFYIPAGMVHAIGKGVTVLEVQQNSNVTYRIFDFNRVDKFGKARELHIDKAIDVSTLSKFSQENSQVMQINEFSSQLCPSEYFTVEHHKVSGEYALCADKSSFVTFTCIEGFGSVGGIHFARGETIFVSAGYGTFIICGQAQIILSKI